MTRHERRLHYLVAAAFVLIFVLALVACSEGNQLEQGEVVEKGYDDPDDWTTTSYDCISYGKYGCALSLPRTVYHHDGPHWSLKVTGVDDDGKERTETHEVTETLYETAQVGQVVNFPEARVVPR